MGGRSPESVQATITLVLQNLEAFFAGRPVLTPVPD
jgi:lactate dehydrogenase-like 2-hydroxyacid dehydrogenase